MESPTMSSGNTGNVVPHTLIERLRDTEFPDYLYVTGSEAYISCYWYADNTLQSARVGESTFENPFKEFLADYYAIGTEIEFSDKREDCPLHQ
jgi:hypothetical protein